MRASEIIIFPEEIYHIYNRANGSEKVYLNENDYYHFLTKYKHYISPIVDTFAYCLLPNHFHLMVKIKSEIELMTYFKTVYPSSRFTEVWDFREVGHAISHQFGRLFSSYTQSFNKLYNRKGALLIPNFKRKLVEDPHYNSKLLAYIHTNPIKHGLTDKIEDWEFSSYHAYTSSRKTNVSTQAMIDFFGSRNELVKFHEDYTTSLNEMNDWMLE